MIFKGKKSSEVRGAKSEPTFVGSQYDSNLESLEVHEMGASTSLHKQEPRAPDFRSVPFSRRKAIIVSSVLTGVVLLFTGVSSFFLTRSDSNRGENPVELTSDLTLRSDEKFGLPAELNGAKEESLLVRGDIITQGVIKISNDSNVMVIQATDLTDTRTFNLPDVSGTFCTDANNCNYAGIDALGQLNTRITQLGQQLSNFSVTATAGVTSVNNQTGVIAIQGSTNRILVNTAGGIITLSTPQDLDSNANVQFGSLTVSAAGTIRANNLTQTGAGNNVSISAGSDSIVFTAGGRSFQLPVSGPGTQTICTDGALCATGGGVAVLLSDGSVQTDADADASIFINDTGGGHLIRLQSLGVDRLAVDNSGNTTVGGSLTVSALGNGFVRSTAGALSVVSAIDLASSDVTNTLPVNRGGTGASSLSANGVLVGNGTSPVSSVAAGGAGLCLVSTAGAPTFTSCPGVSSLNGQSGALTLQGTANQVSVSTAAGVLTLSTPQDINTTSSPTFAALTLTGLGNGVVKASAGTLTTGLVSLTTEVSGTLPVGSGGTGTAVTPTNGQLLIGNGTNYTLATLTQGAGMVITNGAGSITIASAFGNSIDLGSETTGDFVASISGNGGVNITGGSGVGSTPSVALVLQANKGLEVDVNGLSLIDCGLNQILKYDGTNQWVCAADETGSFTVAGDSGTPQTVSNGDTVSIQGGTNITTSAGATDTVTINTVNNPTFTTSVTTPLLQSSGALTITPNGVLTVGAAGQTALLQGSTTTITSNGVGNDIVLSSADQIRFSGFDCTAFANGGTLTTDATGNISCADDNAAPANTITGAGTANRIALFTGAQTVADSWLLQNGSTLEIDNTRNLSLTGGNFSVTGTGLFTGLVTANGGLTIEAGDTFTFNGEAFTDLTGTGLAFSSGSLQTTLGTSVDLTSEVINVLPVANGGTGVDGSTAAAGTLLIGNGTGFTLATITAGSGITVNNSAGGIEVVNVFGTSIESAEITDLTITNADIANSTIDISTKTTGNFVATIAGSSQIDVTGSGSNNAAVTLGIIADSIGDAQLAFNTGQNLTTTSSPSFNGLTLSGNLTVEGGNASIGTAAQAGTLTLSDGSSNTGTLQTAGLGQDTTFTLPDPGAATATICLSTGNCAGAGGGVTTAGGTANRIAIFNGAQTVADSWLLQNGSTLQLDNTRNFELIGGNLTLTNGNLSVTGNQTTSGTVTFSSLSNGFLEVNGSGVVSVGTIDLGTDTAGNYVATITAGNGISGSSNTEGGTPTIALSNLTADWIQSGAFDIVLDNAGAEIRMLESAGSTYYGLFDVGDLSADETYTFLQGGTVITSGNVASYATTAVTAGSGLTGGGTTGALTVNIGAGNGIAVNADDIAVVYGSTANTAVEGDTQITVTAGTNLTGGGTVTLGAGGNLTVNVADSPTFAGSVIVQGGSIIAGTAAQAGSLTLNDGSTNTGTLQTAALGANQTYTLPDDSGTICLSTGNCAGAGGGVTTAGGNANRIAMFSGAQTVADSWLLQNGSTLQLDTARNLELIAGNLALTSGNLNITGNQTTSGTVTFSALANGFLEVNGSGVVSVGTIDLGTDTTGNYVATITAGNGITGSSSSEGGTPTIALGPLSADWVQSGAFDIVLSDAGAEMRIMESAGATYYGSFDVGDLTADETYTFIQGGTVVTSGNVASFATTAVTAGSGLTGGGTTGALTLNIGAGNGITVNANDIAVAYGSTANTAVEGDTQITVTAGTNLTGGGSITLGSGGSVTVNVADSPTFAGTVTVQGSSVSIGTASTTTGSLDLYNAGSAFAGSIQVANLGQATLYTLPDPGQATASICLSTGNCAGTGGGVTTAGGTNNKVAKFNGAQTLADSSITDDGTNVTTSVDLIVQGGSATIGTALQDGALTLYGNGFTGQIAGSFSANRSFSLPDGDGEFCIKEVGNCSGSGGGNAPNSAQYLVLALDAGLSAERTLSFNGTNFSVTDNGANNSYTVNTAQNIATTSAPSFAGLTLTGNLNLNANTIQGTTAVIDFTNFDVAGTGAVTAGTYNGQTISSSASFTGTLSVAGLTTLNGGLTIETGDTLTFNGDAFTDLTGDGLQVTTNVLTLAVQASKGLEVDANGLSLIDCASGEILKYNGSNQWACATDTDTDTGDNISVGGVAATDINFINVTATGTETGTTWTLNAGATPDEVTLTVSNASATQAGSVTTGTQTFAGDKTFNGSVTVAAQQTITMVGGSTAQRPASPTEGMIYFDTTTKTLLTYANGKWQASTGEYIIVAASNSSQAIKDAAHYVADGNTGAAADGDQVQINQALTAASGGKVYLAQGTYVADATILIPNNTTLAGAGHGTVIELADIDTTDNLIENQDTTSGTGVTIHNMRIDGRKDLNTIGTQHGIYFNNMGGGAGAGARQGSKLSNLWVYNFGYNGIHLHNSSNNTLEGNTSQGSNNYGIFISAGSNNILTGNTAQDNDYVGIYVENGSNNTLTSNTAQGNYTGFSLYSSPNSTITGNTAQGNTDTGFALSATSSITVAGNTAHGNAVGFYLWTFSNSTITGNTAAVNTYGIYLDTSSYNTVTSNKIYDNGGLTNNHGIYLSASDSNTIISNSITDTSATTNNYAIYIFNATSDINYLAGNSLGGGSINDAGTGTIYGGQLNGSGNYVIEANAGSIELQSNTNISGTLIVSGLATFNGGLTVETGDTFTVNGDAFTDLTGNGLTVNGSTLAISVEANKGLEADANGLSLIDCATGEILKYNGSNQWACATDAGAAGTGDSVQVNGSDADGANFIDSAASASNVAVTWTLNGLASPDTISLALGAASGSDAGIVTANAQTFGGAKTFNGQIIAGAGIDLGTQTLQGTTAIINFTNFDVDASGNTTIAGNLTVDTDSLVVNSTTNRVGLGVASPTARLDVLGNSAVSSGAVTMTAVNGATTFTTSASITLNPGDLISPDTTSAQSRVVSVGGTGTNFTVNPAFSGNVTGETFTIYPAVARFANSAGVSVLTVRNGVSSGRVGIGTDAPREALDVNGNIGVSANLYLGRDNPSTNTINMGGTSINILNAGEPNVGILFQTDGGDFSFKSNGSYDTLNIDATTGTADFRAITDGLNRLNLRNAANTIVFGVSSVDGSIVSGATALQGSLVINDGSGQTGTLSVANLAANRTYTLPEYTSGTGTICLDSGNCAGSGGGVTTSGGTTNRLAKFTGAQAIGDTAISDNGTLVTIIGAVDLTVEGGDVTVGTTSQQGSILLHDGNGQTTTLMAGNSVGNLAYTLPSADGSNGQCLKTNGTGGWSFSNCNNGSGTGGAITLQDAYNAGNTIATTDNRHIGFTLADTTNDANFLVNIASGSTGKFAVQDNAVDEFRVDSSGTYALTLTLGNALGISYGGTAATTAQGAINNISGLTTNGDLLYHNGTDSTRLARGTNGQCLVSNATTILWSTCTGDGTGVTTVGTFSTTNTAANGATISGSEIIFQSASASAPGMVDTGAQTFAGAKTFNSSVTLAASQTINLTGGVTANRPASPTEGMIYFDTTTKTLLTYANGKWQATTGEYVIVAASNSSQVIKDAAHYVADGNTGAAADGDQVQINAALTAASGGKVYLAPGTYVADATILIPNNTTLAGAGRGTLIELADLDATDDLISNTDQTTGTGVVIQDLRLDGRSDLNTAGSQNGIYLALMGGGTGASARQGGTVANVWVEDFRNFGLWFSNSSNGTVANSTFQNNNSGIGIANTANNNTISGNTVHGNTAYGIGLSGSSEYNAVVGNTAKGNGTGIQVSSSNNNTISGNTAGGNTANDFNIGGSNNIVSSNNSNGAPTGFSIGASSNNFTGNTAVGNTYGYSVLTGSHYNNFTSNVARDSTTNGFRVVTSDYISLNGNYVYNSGGNTANNGIFLDASDNVSIVGNTIYDTSCTTTCYAINISNSTSNGTYLADNKLNGGTINDAATTSSIHGGQVNGSGNYVMEMQTGSIELQSNTNITGTITSSGNATVSGGTLTVGAAAQAGSIVLHDGSGQTATISLGNIAANTVLSLPATLGATDTFCFVTLANCSGAAGANTSLSNLTATNINQALNATSGNLSLTTTTSGNIVLNSASTIELQDNTNVAGSISVTQSSQGAGAGINIDSTNIRLYTNSGNVATVDLGANAYHVGATSSNATPGTIAAGRTLTIKTFDNGSFGQFDFDVNGSVVTTIGRTGNITTNGTGTFSGASVTIGAAALQGSLVLNDGNGGQTATIQLGNISANTVLSLPATLGATDTFCFVTLGNCTGAAGANTSLSNLTATNINQALNATSGNLTLTTTTSGNIVLNSAGTIELQDNTNISGSVTVAAQQTITMVGGTTAQRPASPTEGMIYFDTTTKTLLTYANGKWQATTGEYVIVAASNSSQAIKDAAHYVADGNTGAAADGDQVQINAALTAASGGKVYLAPGTYVADATILIPNNTTLAGAGRGTLIELADLDVTENLIENAGGATTGITIQDMSLSGRKDLNTVGTQYGIHFSSVAGGWSAAVGGTITNVKVENFLTEGINFLNTDNTTMSGLALYGNGIGIGLYYAADNGSSNNTITNSTFISNGTGVYVSNGNAVITGNSFSYNDYGISIAHNNSVITGNTLLESNTSAIYVNGSGNLISGNQIRNSGGATTNNGIWLYGSNADGNTISDNDVFDNSCTTTCYGINISTSNADGNILLDNRAGTINDAGNNGTRYAGQSMTGDGADMLFRAANSATAFRIQNASGSSILNVNTTTAGVDVLGNLTVGNSSSAGNILLHDGSGQTATISLGNIAANTVLSLPATLGATDTFCFQSLGNCSGGAPSSGIAGAIQFSDGANAFSSDATNFFWDDTNNRMGLGTSSPSTRLHVAGVTQDTQQTILTVSALNTSAQTKSLTVSITAAAATPDALISTTGGASLSLSANSSTPHMTIATTSYIGVGTTTPDYHFDLEHNQNGAVVSRIANTRNGGNDIAALYMSTFSTTNQFQLRVHNSGLGYSGELGGSNSVNFNNIADGDMAFLTNNTMRLVLDNSNNAYFGNGVTNATPSGYAINATGGSGTNIAGANLTIAGGRGTGSAAGGNINFQTTAAGTSGTTANSLVTVMSLQGGTGAATFQNTTNSSSALRVLTQAGTSAFAVDTTPNSSNLVIEPSFENTSGATQWANYAAGPHSRTSSEKYMGAQALQVNTGAGVDGARSYTVDLAPSTTYTFTLHAKLASGSFTTMEMGHNPTNFADVSCLTGQTVTTTGWTKFSCTFTTGASISSDYVYIKQTDSTARTFYIDAVSVVATSSVVNYAEANFSLNGVITSPAVFKNQSDSTTAFQIQNASGTGILVADSINGRVGIGTSTPAGRLHIAGSTFADSRIITERNADDGLGSSITLRKSRGTNAAPTDVQMNDTLGLIYGGGYQDGDYRTAGYLGWVANDVTQANQVGSNFYIAVRNAASGTDLATFKIVEAGRVGIGMGTSTVNAKLQVNAEEAGTIATIIQGAASQTADLLQVRTSTDTILASFTASGVLKVATTAAETLSGAKLLTTNAEITTALRVGTATDGVSFNDGVSGKLRLRGTARNDVNVVLRPEFEGITLNGTGVGTLTSGFCSNRTGGLIVNSGLCAADTSHSYYQWSSAETTAQSYDMYIRYTLPSDFDGFAASDTLKLYGYRDLATDIVAYSLYEADGDQCGSTTTVTSTNDTWQEVALTGDETGCTFAAGDVITVKITVTSEDSGNAYVGEMRFTYKSVF